MRRTDLLKAAAQIKHFQKSEKSAGQWYCSIGSFWGSVQLLVLGVCRFFPLNAVIADTLLASSRSRLVMSCPWEGGGPSSTCTLLGTLALLAGEGE